MKRHDQRGIKSRDVTRATNHRIQEALDRTRENRMKTAELLNSVWKASKAKPITVSDVANTNKINTEYARQVLGLMVKHELIWLDDEQMEYNALEDVQGAQVHAVLEALGESGGDRADAKAVNGTKPYAGNMDSATPVKAKPAPKGRSNVTSCLCGCGALVAGKSFYKPGHDARHAGQVARQLVELHTTKAARPEHDAAIATLPSEKLQNKALLIAGRMIERTTTKKAGKA